MDTKDVVSTATSPQGAEIGNQIRELTLRQQRLDRQLSTALGTDLAGLDTLGYLMATGPATPTDLARHLGISTAATTLVLQRLETAGHITRERHASDGRKLLVKPVEASAAQAAQQVAPLIDAVEQLTSTLDTEQRRTVTAFLDQVIACYDVTLQRLRSR